MLESLGLTFQIAPPDIDESLGDGPVVDEIVALAGRKARAVDAGALPILAADTVVEIDGDILGKPADQADGAAMLQRLSDRWHRVISGAVLIHGDAMSHCATVTEVRMGPWSRAQIAAYWASGEPEGKAGGYAIQGLAASWVRELRGSYTGVVGLPLFEVANLLRGAGIEVVAP